MPLLLLAWVLMLLLSLLLLLAWLLLSALARSSSAESVFIRGGP